MTILYPTLRLLAYLTAICLLLFRCSDLTSEELLAADFFDFDTKPPTIAISEPTDGALNLYGEAILFRGTAADDSQVARVEYAIGDSDFKTATGNELWEFEINTFELVSSRGEATTTVIARAIDQNGNTEQTEINIGTAHPLYVSKNGDDENEGLIGTPLLTITAALTRANTDGAQDVYVAAGQFTEFINIKTDISLFGSYSDDFTTRNATDYSTEITGVPERGFTLAISQNENTKTTEISGFEITGPLFPGTFNAVLINGQTIDFKNNQITIEDDGSYGCSNNCNVNAIRILDYSSSVNVEANKIRTRQVNDGRGIFATAVDKVKIYNNLIDIDATNLATGVQTNFVTQDIFLLHNTIQADAGNDKSHPTQVRDGAAVNLVNNILIGSGDADCSCYKIQDDTYTFTKSYRSPDYFQGNFLVNCPRMFYDGESPANSFDPTDTTDLAATGIYGMQVGPGTSDTFLLIEEVTANLCASSSAPDACDTSAVLTDIFTDTDSFTLKSNSAAVDAGLSAFDYSSFSLEELITNDLDGNSRTAPFDIGALEIED